MGLDTKTPSRAGFSTEGQSIRLDHEEGRTRASEVLSRLVQELAVSPPSIHLPGASRVGPGRECAEAAFGTHLDQHTILWLCINNHSITRAHECEPSGPTLSQAPERRM